MKNSFLFMCGLGIALGASSQNKVMQKYIATKPPIIMDENSSSAGLPVIKTERKTPLVITNTAVCDMLAGKAGNAYGGFTRPGREILDYNAALNTLTITHRTIVPPDASTGYLRFDVSKDGGTTWSTNQGPLYTPGPELARYPQGWIYNPSGNTVPDSAYISYHAPSCGGCTATGDLWNWYIYGAAKIGSPSTTATQMKDTYTANTPHGLIPSAGVITANGIIWVCDEGYDGTDYTDTIWVRKGTWNAATKMHTYTTQKISFPVALDATAAKMYVTQNIAFSANGQTGYLSALANHDTTVINANSNALYIWKTTDGGNTWNGPTWYSLNCAGSQLGGTGAYTSGLEMDGAVDTQGKLHLIFAIGANAGGGAINTAPGAWGEFSAISDGDTTRLQLLAKPETFRGHFGAAAPNGINEDSRGQISMSLAGDKVFYVWFDTDTTIYPGGNNTNPNLWTRMYDVTSKTWSAATNLTSSTIADGVMTFGYVAYWAKGSGFPYSIQAAYQQLTATDTDPVNFHYVCGLDVTSTTTSAGTPCVPVKGSPAALSVTSITFTPRYNCPSIIPGTATVSSVSGGVQPFSYLWSPGGQITATATGLTAGTYTVVVTDALSATATGTVTIPSVSLPLPVTASSTALSCFGGNNGTGTASTSVGTPPYTYSWMPSSQTTQTATGLSAGTYTVTITSANGCVGSAMVTITGPTAIVVNTTSIPASNPTTANGSATATVTGGVPPYIYSWNTSPVQTTSTATGLLAGNYTVCITDANGCSKCNPVYVSAVGINEIVAGAYVTISPNPFSSTANVKIDLINPIHGNIIFIVYDLFGKEVQSIDLSQAKGKTIDFTINKGNISNGMYFYKVQDNANILMIGKLVIQ